MKEGLARAVGGRLREEVLEGRENKQKHQTNDILLFNRVKK